MRYQIVVVSPIYHPVYDGIVGSEVSRRLPYTYETLACAVKVAQRLNIEDETLGGDNSFRVVSFGDSPFDPRSSILDPRSLRRAPGVSGSGLGLCLRLG